MQLRWSNNNETLTLEVSGTGGHPCNKIIRDYDKMILLAVSKYVCDIAQLKSHMAAKVGEIAHKCNQQTDEINRLKRGNLLRRIWNFIKFPE